MVPLGKLGKAAGFLKFVTDTFCLKISSIPSAQEFEQPLMNKTFFTSDSWINLFTFAKSIAICVRTSDKVTQRIHTRFCSTYKAILPNVTSAINCGRFIGNQ